MKFISCTGWNTDPTRWIECVAKVDLYLSSNQRQWLVVHFHHRNPGMHWLKHNVTRWRKQVHSQGCKFISTVNFREPLARMKSLIFFNGVQKENLDNWIMDYGAGKYPDAQLGYFLWNWYSPNQQVPIKLTEPNETRSLTSETSVEFLQVIQTFDIVGFTKNLVGFIDKIEEATKWKTSNTKHVTNVTPKQKKYLITDKQKELMRQATHSELRIYEDLKLQF